MQAKVVWDEGMAFKAHLNNFELTIDAPTPVGGKNRGPRPKGLVLVALAGCTAMDVVSILKKHKVELEGFEVSTVARLAEQHPKKIEQVTIRYDLQGTDVPEQRVKQAVELSQDAFCGVVATLRPTVAIDIEIWINGAKID